MPGKSQILATYPWQERDSLFAPSHGRNRHNHPMATIMVSNGDEKKEFIMHRDILTIYKPKLLEQILGPVGKTTAFNLEADPGVFLGLLQFAYRGRFWISETVNNIEILWGIYIFVEKRELKYLLDILMDRITAFYYKTKTLPSIDTIKHVYQHTLPESETHTASMARRFVARCFVAISINCLYGAKCDETSESLAEVIGNTEGLLLDTLNATRNPAGIKSSVFWKVDIDPRKVKPCDYHQHAWNVKCRNCKETPFNSETDR